MRDLAKIKASGGVLLPELQAVALKTAGSTEGRNQMVLHASEMAAADWCHRASYLRLTGKPVPVESFSFVRESIFDEGNSIHAKWQERMRQTGKLWGSWSCLICKQWLHNCHEPSPMAPGCVKQIPHIWKYEEVHFSHGIIEGHEDGAMIERDGGNIHSGHDPYLVEVKSLSSGTVRVYFPSLLYKHTYKVGIKSVCDLEGLWNDIKRPFSGHVRQGNIYLWLAKQLGMPFETVRFLYEYKPTQKVKEFVIPMSEDVLKPILTGVAAVEYALETGTAPPCPHGGCKHCEEKDAGNAQGAEGTAPSAGVQRRRKRPGRAGDQSPDVGTTSRRRKATTAASRPDVRTRRDSDVPDQGSQRVAGVPDGAGSGSGGGRTVRFKRANSSRGNASL